MSYRYIDTHAHLNIGAFKDDAVAVAEKCAEEGVSVINVGTKFATSKRAVEIAGEADNCYAIVGLHPIQTTQADHDEDEIGEGGDPFASKGEVFDTDAFRELAQHPKVVGIGECGFDYYRVDASTRDVQEEQFIKQIELANELGLPLMIHTRPHTKLSAAHPQEDERTACSRKLGVRASDAYDDTLSVLKQYAKVPGNIHFYAGTYEQAKKFFDIGFAVSFTGVITFTDDYNETIQNAPLSMLHAETDCPFVAPVPYRGKRAEPWMVREVYKKIAEIRGESEEEVRHQLVANAYKHYGF